jgi:acylphosphatase
MPGDRAIRVTATYSGNVQGVGFRYTARSVAKGHAVSGYVRNLFDGSVELVAEGPADEVERFLEAVGQEMGGYIRKTLRAESPATGEFEGFSVRH